MIRNPKWKRDEVILALDLYFKVNPSHISNTDKRIKELSDLLNILPIHNQIEIQSNFRNSNGVYMKLCNFLPFDPNYHGKGLDAGSKLDKEIWDEFFDDHERLSKVADSIRQTFASATTKASISIPVDDEDEFVEGRILCRKHKGVERNSKVIKKAKQQALDNNELRCEICGFDFQEVYGDVGEGYIECHHIIPVSEYKKDMKTKLSDLALVCSNCHRMLHRKRPWMKPEELKKLMDI